MRTKILLKFLIPTFWILFIASCSLLDEVLPDAESIALSETDITLAVGEQKQVNVILTPDELNNNPLVEINWKSSNPSVAAVENGLITALSEGTALISAAYDGLWEGVNVVVKQNTGGSGDFQILPDQYEYSVPFFFDSDNPIGVTISSGCDWTSRVESTTEGENWIRLVKQSAQAGVSEHFIEFDHNFDSNSRTGKIVFENNIGQLLGEIVIHQEGSPEDCKLYYTLHPEDATIPYPRYYNGENSFDGVQLLGARQNDSQGILLFDRPVTKIGDFAFMQYANLKGITFPESLKVIGVQAFTFCEGLQDISLPGSLEKIDHFAFTGCYNLQYHTGELVFPESVTYIGDGAFDDCKSVFRIELPDRLDYLGRASFGGTPLTEVYVPYVAQIDGNPFLYCANLTKFSGVYSEIDDAFLIDSGRLISIAQASRSVFEVPEGVYIIGDSALGYIANPNLEGIILPGSVHTFEELAFAYNLYLREIIIPSDVTVISESCFTDCEMLESVLFRGDITEIGQYSFTNCISLSYIEIPDSVLSIGQAAFHGCDNLELMDFWPMNPPKLYYPASNDLYDWPSLPDNQNLSIRVRNANAFNAYSASDAGLPGELSSDNWFYYEDLLYFDVN